MTLNNFQTPADCFYFNKLYESVKTIFKIQLKEWTCQQILRFLNLLKVQSLQTLFYQFKITGQLLFDLNYLWQQMIKYLQSKTYFPIMKLMYTILKINLHQRKYSQNAKFVFKKSKNSAKPNQKQQKSKSQTQRMESSQNFQDGQETEESLQVDLQYLKSQGQILQALSKEFRKLGESLIADLSSNQIAKILKSTQIQKGIKLSQRVKKYSIDGYCIVILLAQRQSLLEEISSFFTIQQMEEFDEILNLFLPFYYRQMSQNQNQQRNSSLNLLQNYNYVALQKSDTKTTEDLTDPKQSFGRSQYGTSEIYGESQQNTSEFGTSQFGTSQYQSGTTQIRKSQYGRSQLARSQLGRSELGNSEYPGSIYQKSQYQYASSQYATSQRGSVRNSLAQSVMGDSVIYQAQQKPQKRKDVRVSSVQDISIIQKLKDVALTLPFNLFKMDPLQNIRVTTLNYPFTLNFSKPKSHQQFVRNLKQSVEKLKLAPNATTCTQDFNIAGVKFGRSQQNDYKYPDQLSISGKHAQIGFWDNKYQLVDLQSKTGTFIYIPLTRPLILKDQQIIQLSNQIEIVVHILKKELNQGVIKLEFTKPQNQPFYKATLKQNQTLKIGRSEKSHIKLCQQSISSKHTQIKYQNQQFKIYDCLSSTGTWLRLSKKGIKSEMFPLQQGDIIRISSKRTYLIQKMTNSLQEDDDQFQQLQGLLENPNFKVIRENSEDNFNKIIQNTWKRKTPYEINNQKLQKPYQ